MSTSFNNSSLPPASLIWSSLPPTVATEPNNIQHKRPMLPVTPLRNPVAPPSRKRRNELDPDAELIMLSPRTIMATNIYVCEVCNQKFQRDQNLQLHRRTHNLPWKLKQTEVVRKKVYLCPEPLCAHHHPAHALGDLTGIKKHYHRKHGEKRYKCDKCSKRYAVKSDLKAHFKICRTKEHKWDLDFVFSRSDSLRHMAFCDVPIQESSFYGVGGGSRLVPFGNNNLNLGYAPPSAHVGWSPSSMENFDGFIPHSSNPNPVPPNLLMNQNQPGLLDFEDRMVYCSNPNTDHLFRQLGYRPYNTNRWDTIADHHHPQGMSGGAGSTMGSGLVSFCNNNINLGYAPLSAHVGWSPSSMDNFDGLIPHYPNPNPALPNILTNKNHPGMLDFEDRMVYCSNPNTDHLFRQLGYRPYNTNKWDTIADHHHPQGMFGGVGSTMGCHDFGNSPTMGGFDWFTLNNVNGLGSGLSGAPFKFS